MGVQVAGPDLPLILHLDGGGEGFSPRGGAHIQHPAPRLRVQGHHRQPGGRVLDVKEAVLEGVQLLQAAAAGEDQTVFQPGVGLPVDPLRLEGLQRPLQVRFHRVHHGGDGGLAVVGLEKGRRPLAAQGLQQLPHQPHRVAVQGGVILRRVVLGNGGQAVQAALQIPQDGVHHAGGPGILAVGPGEGHRLVHRRAVGDAGQKQHLIEPQPQGLKHLPLQPPQGDVGELGQVEVQQNAVLNHPEAQLGGQARVPAVQAGGGDLLFQHSVRPAPLPLAGVQGEQGDLTCVHMLLLLRFVVHSFS